MDKDETPIMTLKQIVAAVENISVADQEKLLASLKDKSWARAANRLLHADIERGSQSFIDSLSAGRLFDHFGNVPNGINAMTEKWSNRVKILAQMQDSRFNEKLNLTQEEIEEKLERSYQETQAQLINIRIAAATAIATEKQLEQQLEKDLSQAETWQSRAEMARQQGNEDLAQQALQRKQQYVQSAEDLTKQLHAQRMAGKTVRQKLTECETIVQKIYTRKQIMIARNKVASALSIFHELVVDFQHDDSDENSLPTGEEISSETFEVVSKTLTTLERASATIIALEEKVQALEKKLESEGNAKPMQGT
ncbi:MAG: PspA/IM30 family protein [Cyanobacteria bacterium SZAS-4]|nr:PspA/IM30 family protein [Cyanobacteria bacterium SZAS-4]